MTERRLAEQVRIVGSGLLGTSIGLGLREHGVDVIVDDASPAARRLFDAYADAARASGFETTGEFVGGCADSGFTAAVGAPTLCAVGPVGGRAHTPEEYLRLDTLVPRAQACARVILGLDRAGL